MGGRFSRNLARFLGTHLRKIRRLILYKYSEESSLLCDLGHSFSYQKPSTRKSHRAEDLLACKAISSEEFLNKNQRAFLVSRPCMRNSFWVKGAEQLVGGR